MRLAQLTVRIADFPATVQPVQMLICVQRAARRFGRIERQGYLRTVAHYIHVAHSCLHAGGLLQETEYGLSICIELQSLLSPWCQ